MTMIREERPRKGSFDYLLEPLRDDVWNEPPVRDYAPAIPPPPPEPPRPPKVTVNIEIVHRQPQKAKPRSGLSNAVIIWIIAFGLILLAIANGHAQERWTSYRQGWQTFHQGDDGSTGRSYKQGFTTYTDMQLPDGSTSHCRSYKQGWQTITECN